MIKHIDISGHEYTIEQHDHLDAKNVIGQFRPVYLKIELLNGLAESVKAESLIHEILHAICYHAGLASDEDGMIDEELMVNAIANGLFQLGFKPPIK